MVQYSKKNYLEMCNFPSDLIDEHIEWCSESIDFSDEEEYSPRTQSFAERFELESGEKLIKTYTVEFFI